LHHGKVPDMRDKNHHMPDIGAHKLQRVDQCRSPLNFLPYALVPHEPTIQRRAPSHCVALRVTAVLVVLVKKPAIHGEFVLAGVDIGVHAWHISV
jgi:hypothetical protein